MLGVVGSPNMRLVLNPEGGALGEPTAASWRGEHPVLAGFQVMCLDSMQRLGSSSSVQYVQLYIGHIGISWYFLDLQSLLHCHEPVVAPCSAELRREKWFDPPEKSSQHLRQSIEQCTGTGWMFPLAYNLQAILSFYLSCLLSIAMDFRIQLYYNFSLAP